MDEKPFPEPQTVTEVVELFSARAAAELERLATTSLNERLGKIVEASVSEAYVFGNRTFQFELVNRGARENLGFTMEELRDLAPWDLKPEYTEDEFRSYVKPLLNGEVEILQFTTVHMRKDGSTYPVSVQLQYFPDEGEVFFASITDETERRAREEREKLILNEMNHRAKNVLAVVQVLARQTAKRNPEDYVSQLEARIAGLSASHNVLVQNSWKDVPFDELIRSQLGHFEHMIGDRITVSGPPTRIKATAAQGFGLALHELATNAAKYGALSTESGSVAIAWREIDQGDERNLELTWIESGGPEVVAPESSGFGSFMIEKSLTSQFGCKVNLDYDPKGFRCEFFAPAERVLSG
ncbi:putative chemotaxis methyltransferase protein [Erythrobacter litoralis HTCC2594]|uniref:histidine kinase n=2 Tax=Erythrobacter litoralis TaxID=39960 RepID=Q2NBL4_ERYLH|nr:putative chemotaxis methyltransferase protein [Erythrobacter litoralis HTCC2594]